VPAGFWRRLGASAVDAILLAGVLALQSLALLSLTVIGMTIATPNASKIELPAAQILIAVAIVQLIISWLYSALLISSAWRATLGKRLAGLEVTDLRGDPISFARATARYAAKRLTPLTFYFGFLMCAVSARRQGLHDMIAGTLVVRRRMPSPERARRPADGFDTVEIRRALDDVLAAGEGRLPANLQAMVDEIRLKILALLPHASSFPLGSRDLFVLQRISTDYLPTSVGAYLALPQREAAASVLLGGRTALQVLGDQLDLLRWKTGEIGETIRQQDSERLLVHGRFLEDSFGRPSGDLTLPPAQP
jgi:uncharacterized RDD family membrane protein YckC